MSFLVNSGVKKTERLNVAWSKSLKFRLIGFSMCVMFLLCTIILFSLSRMYQSRIDSEYSEKATFISILVASQLNGEAIDQYLNTLEKDAEYERILDYMRETQYTTDVMFIYVTRFVAGGSLFVLDSDRLNPVGLGVFDTWGNRDPEVLARLVRGEKVQPYVSSTKWGWLLTAYEPVLRADGSVAGYVGVDISMEEVMQERAKVLGSLSVLVLMIFLASAASNLYVIQRLIITPVNLLVKSVSDYSPGEAPDESFKHSRLRMGDELDVLNRTVADMKLHINNTMNESEKNINIMTNIMNTMDVHIYISDMETDEILFANQKMITDFNMQGSYKGDICWKVFQPNQEKRCDFCPKNKLAQNPDEPVVWERKNPLTGKFMNNTDCVIDWPGGRKVHMEQSVDISDIRQTQEALSRREKMLHVLNETAIIFLSQNDETFFDTLTHSTGVIVDMVDLDRLSVWRNSAKPDGLRVSQIYRWDKDSGGATAQKAELQNVTYAQLAPSWEKILSAGGCINGIAHLLPDAEKLLPYGCVSVFVTPVIIDSDFWGFVFFEDHSQERTFTEDEADVLRSASLMMANTVNRHTEAAKIREANRVKSEFLSRMSHEMRTPMNAIMGMTVIGRNSPDAERKDYSLNKIDEASAHLLGIINDILDISIFEADKLELTLSEFNLEAMLQKAVSLVRFSMDEKRQRFSINVDSSAPRSVTGDVQRLTQVTANLLSNAVKFTHEKGEISLAVSLEREEDEFFELRIEVADNGIGISPENHEKIFSMFEQAEGGINRNYGGAGLGLAISKRIVERMGGVIWVESEPGKGSRFIFTVKLMYAEKNRKAGKNSKEGENNKKGKKSADESTAFKNKVILLAEDIEINREILISLLDGTGLIIEVAENGREALDMITAAPDLYDLVFMDMQMPEMDGLEATRRIRAALSGRNLPIVAMTANVYKEDIENCLAAGMDDYVGKPLDIDLVFEKLRKYL